VTDGAGRIDGMDVSATTGTAGSGGQSREVGVMGSARLGEESAWWARAHSLGALLAEAGFAVVTGGYGGLMAAVSRGAHEQGGRVIGLPMRHWKHLEPNPWNGDLRWSESYATRIGHLLRCDAVVALPGGVGTLAEMAVMWSALQTEQRSVPLVLLGECWPPVMRILREQLVIGDEDVDLLGLADTPEEAVAFVRKGLREGWQVGQGPRG
jgi:uncharacterized protein (TIGR00730 family)